MYIDQQVVSRQVQEVQQQYPGSSLSQNRLRVPIVSVGTAIEVVIPQRYPWEKPDVFLLRNKQSVAANQGLFVWPGEWNAGWTLLMLVQTVEQTLYWGEQQSKPAPSNDSRQSMGIDELVRTNAQLQAANNAQIVEVDKLKEMLQSSKARTDAAKAELAAAEQRVKFQEQVVSTQSITQARVAELQSRISAYRQRSEELSWYYRKGTLSTEDFQRDYAEVRSRLHLLESVLSRLS